MDAQIAVQILTWAAIVVLYLGLAAVLREVKLLRGQLAADAASGGLPSVRLPASVVGGRRRIVAAVDSSCPLCLVVADQLATTTGVRPVVLTYEAPERWSEAADRLDVVRDEQAWSAIAHLSPPVLMLVDADGAVERLDLPANERDVERAVRTWSAQLDIAEEKPNVA